MGNNTPTYEVSYNEKSDLWYVLRNGMHSSVHLSKETAEMEIERQKLLDRRSRELYQATGKNPLIK